jgi:hypothetical protein
MRLAELINRPLTVVLVWLTLAAGFVYIYIFEPGKTGFFPGCPFRAVTGFACPGCGGTRGMHSLLHGDVVGAFEFNPLFVISIPFLVYALVRYSKATIHGRAVKGNQVPPAFLYVLFAVILSFWIFRNTPWYPFPA